MADQAGAPSKAEEKKPEDAVEDVPDPDEDDLDDLDGEPIATPPYLHCATRLTLSFAGT